MSFTFRGTPRVRFYLTLYTALWLLAFARCEEPHRLSRACLKWGTVQPFQITTGQHAGQYAYGRYCVQYTAWR